MQYAGEISALESPFAKEVELAEHLLLIEVKLFDFGLCHQLLPCETILFLV